MTTDPESTRTRKVLYIDDEAGLIRLVPIMLKRGFEYVEVVTAEDGFTGLELADSVKPDLILLDDMLPGMDGIEVLQRLKRDPDLRHVPVVMLAGRADPESIHHCLELGADDYITKPFLPNTLMNRLSRFLESPNRQDA